MQLDRNLDVSRKLPYEVPHVLCLSENMVRKTRLVEVVVAPFQVVGGDLSSGNSTLLTLVQFYCDDVVQKPVVDSLTFLGEAIVDGICCYCRIQGALLGRRICS